MKIEQVPPILMITFGLVIFIFTAGYLLINFGSGICVLEEFCVIAWIVWLSFICSILIIYFGYKLINIF